MCQRGSGLQKIPWPVTSPTDERRNEVRAQLPHAFGTLHGRSASVLRTVSKSAGMHDVWLIRNKHIWQKHTATGPHAPADHILHIPTDVGQC